MTKGRGRIELASTPQQGPESGNLSRSRSERKIRLQVPAGRPNLEMTSSTSCFARGLTLGFSL